MTLSVTQFGKPLPKEKYTWDEKTKIFSSKVIEDKYGDFIREINLATLIKILKKEDHSYRHIPAIIGMLESVALHMEDHNLIALHFGH